MFNLRTSRTNYSLLFEDKESIHEYTNLLLRESQKSNFLSIPIQYEKNNDDLENIKYIQNVIYSIFSQSIVPENGLSFFKHFFKTIIFAKIFLKLFKIKSEADLKVYLSDHDELLAQLINRLLYIRKKDFVILVNKDFDKISKVDQPNLAGFIHRLTKGKLCYFQLCSTSTPILYKKTSMEETGIQINHDFSEVKMY